MLEFVDPLSSWLLTQAIGPALVAKGLGLLRRPDWRARLLRDVKGRVSVRIPKRRVIRWLADETVWNDMVAMSPDALDRLRQGLSNALRPRLLPSTEKRMSEAQLVAEAIVPLLVAQLLANLDPSYTTAVSHVQTMQFLEGIDHKLDALADAARGGIPDNAPLPPGVTSHLDRLRLEERSQYEAILSSVFGPEQGPVAALIELFQGSPLWVNQLRPHGKLALGLLAEAYGAHEAAAFWFNGAADDGAPLPISWRLRASLQLGAAGQIDEARDSLRAILEDSPSNELAALVSAALDDRFEELARSAEAYEQDAPFADLVFGLGGNAAIVLREWDLAIDLSQRQIALEPEATSARVRLAQALLARATQGATASYISDCEEAARFSREARDRRRTWKGASGEAVAVLCRALVLGGARESAISAGRPLPDGEATADEASHPEVLEVLVGAAIAAHRLDIARSVIPRLRSPSDRHFFKALLAEAEDAPPATIGPLYEQALGEADSFDRIASSIAGLAGLGVWPLPRIDEVAAAAPDDAQVIQAMSELARGLHEEAASRLRPLPHKPKAIELLGIVEEEGGDVEAAFATLRDGGIRVGDYDLVAKALGVLLRHDQIGRADTEAQALLAAVPPSSRAGVALRHFLIDLALHKRQWRRAQDYAAALLAEAHEDTQARWSLVGALFNQGRTQEAWDSSRTPPPLQPEDELTARLWLELYRRHAEGEKAVANVLSLGDSFAHSEQVSAAALIAVFGITQRSATELPDVLAQRFQQAVTQFLQRFPQSELFRAIPADMDALQKEIRESLAEATQQLYDLSDKVRDQGYPYVVVSAFSQRSYAEALLKRAVGCLPQTAEDTREEDLRIAFETTGPIVVDISVLACVAIFPSLWNRIVGRFTRISLSTTALRDMEDARDSLSLRPTATLGWDPVSDSMRYSEIEQHVADELATRSQWLLDVGTHLSIEDFDPASLPGPAPERYAAALSSLELSRRLEVPLLVDDLGLRRMARNDGLDCFDSLSLTLAMEQTGSLPAGSYDEYRHALLRSYVVDLPYDDTEFLALGDEESWGIGAAAFSLARPWNEERLERYKLAIRRVSVANLGSIPSWIALAIHGAALGRPLHRLDRLAAVLCAFAMSTTNFQSDLFRDCLAALRRELVPRGANDPLPAISAYLFTSIEEHTGPAVAAQLVINLCSGLDEADRLTALATVLGNPASLVDSPE